jgi:hypothetical protein
MATTPAGMQPHRGTMILVLGILSLVIGCLGPILGPIAWIMGNKDLQEIRAGRMDPAGEQTTNIGRILGMVGTILWAAGILLYCLIVGVLGGIGAFSGRPAPPKRASLVQVPVAVSSVEALRARPWRSDAS